MAPFVVVGPPSPCDPSHAAVRPQTARGPAQRTSVEDVPWTEIIAALLLTLMVAVAIEVAEVGSRLLSTPLRYGDRLQKAEHQSKADRAGGIVLAAAAIWFFALPWVARAGEPAVALVLFLAMCTVGVMLLHRVHHASVRYPAATAAPLLAVAVAAAIT